jgi:hypothetical protein
MAVAVRRQASRLLPRRPRAHFSIFFGWRRCVADAQMGPQAQPAKKAKRRRDARDEGVSQEVAELRSKKRKIRDREERLHSAYSSRWEIDNRSHVCFVEEVRTFGAGSPLDQVLDQA